ncbi:MAG: hypothetical protein KAI53_04910 [Candidatus Aenigmarchaeota archaeon]|nr:hypothetical protein [Candidatus Aenigmarchaeota archaeon]
MGEFLTGSCGRGRVYEAFLLLPAIQKHIENTLLKKLKYETDKTIYALGCGDTTMYSPNNKMVYVDSNKAALGETEKNLKESGRDLSTSVFLNNPAVDVIPKYDGIALLCWSLHHMISKDDKTIDNALLEKHINYLSENYSRILIGEAGLDLPDLFGGAHLHLPHDTLKNRFEAIGFDVVCEEILISKDREAIVNNIPLKPWFNGKTDATERFLMDVFLEMNEDKGINDKAAYILDIKKLK